METSTQHIGSVGTVRGCLVAVELASAAKEAGIIGSVTFWSLRGVSVRRADLRAELAAIGLGFAMPKDPKPQAVLRTAVESVRRASNESIVFDRVSDTPTEVVYASSARRTDETTERAEYVHRTRVRVSKATGAIQLEDSTDDVSRAVEAEYLRLRDWMPTAEFGSILTSIMRGRGKDNGLCGVNLRGEAGGVYFVPALSADRLEAVADLVDRVAGVGSLTVWPVPAGSRTVSQVQAGAREYFLGRVAETKADVADLLAAIRAEREAGAIAEDAHRVVTRFRTFEALEARASVFGDILGDLRSELAADLDVLRAEIKAALDGAIGEV